MTISSDYVGGMKGGSSIWARDKLHGIRSERAVEKRVINKRTRQYSGI